jgi:lysophospholipase L1-like esterase
MRHAFRVTAFLAAALLAALVSCSDDTTGNALPDPVHVTVLSLGDSYTAGEAVPAGKSWPEQLSDALVADRVIVTQINVIARTGWTTTDLLDTLDSHTPPPHDFVTLQIGVNNQFGRLPLDVFEAEFPQLLDRAVVLAGDDPKRVLVLSIPDYSVTPVGSRIDPDRVHSEIDTYNGLIRSIAEERGVAAVDITEISRQALDDPTLVARDGLHPSAKMYQLWVELLRPVVAERLKRRAIFGPRE